MLELGGWWDETRGVLQGEESRLQTWEKEAPFHLCLLRAELGPQGRCVTAACLRVTSAQST